MIKDYQSEVKFNVGQRVSVDIPEIPKKERDVVKGTIIAIQTKFPATPKLRTISYLIEFDNRGNYIKKEFQLAGGIEFRMWLKGDNLS